MQRKNKNSLILRENLGLTYKELRLKATNKTRSKIEDKFDIAKTTIARVENAQFDCKLITLWKTAEAINVKPSKIISALEEKLGDNFKLIDE